MKREQIAMLVGGFAFGVLVGYGLATGIDQEPGQAAAPVPQQAQPPAQPQAGAPMMAEIGQLREILKLDPDNVTALTRMAHLYHDAAMWSQAIGFYERVVELAPGDPNIMTDLGTCYGGAGRNEDAIAMFRKAREADPSHWQSLYNTVIIAGLNMHDFETAEEALRAMGSVPGAAQHIPKLREALDQARAAHPD